MKLWILRGAIPPEAGTAWDSPIAGKMFGLIVRAPDAGAARAVADRFAGKENDGGRHPWLDPEQSGCDELTAEGEPGLVYAG